MTKYEIILDTEDVIIKLLNIGIVSIKLLDWKVYYEFYLQECTRYKPSEAINMVAANYRISKRQMQRIVAYMES